MPEGSGEDFIRAADEIDRESARWIHLKAAGIELRRVGSLKAAAEQAQSRVDNLKTIEADTRKSITQLQAEAAATKGKADDYARSVKGEADNLKREAEQHLTTRKAEASKIVADAKTEAAKHIADGKAQGQQHFDQKAAEATEHEDRIAAAKDELRRLEAQRVEKQAALDEVDGRLKKIMATIGG